MKLPMHALALMLATPMTATAQLVVVEWDAAGQFTKELSVQAGKFVEVCEKLPKGTTVSWSFDAAAPMDFNIHYHEGKKVHFPARKDAASNESGKLEVRLEQDYCWMWSNKASADTKLAVTLKRG